MSLASYAVIYSIVAVVTLISILLLTSYDKEVANRNLDINELLTVLFGGLLWPLAWIVGLLFIGVVMVDRLWVMLIRARNRKFGHITHIPRKGGPA